MSISAVRTSQRSGYLLGAASIALIVAGAVPLWAEGRPTGGKVVAGDAAIAGGADGLLITQTSDRAVIDWAGFSVAGDQFVNFDNGDGATLNRVTGDSISRIDGTLSATGSVFVLNQNGVVIGRDGVVDVGGSFVASTLGLSNSGFMRGGDQVFAGPSAASVINLGRIGALGGDVALIGAHVENRGTITAPGGTAALVAGYDVLMRDAALAGGQFVVRLGGPDTTVLNAGRIEAAAAELRANQGNVLALAGNTDGLIRADGIATQGGRIFLTAPGGRLTVDAPIAAQDGSGAGGEIVLNAAEISISGLIDASSLTGQGGQITVEGDMINLNASAVLDATGTAGGLIRIGGDLQGGQEPGFGAAMVNATDVSVSHGTRITADGLSGAGGNIVLWADRNMTFRGAISATGAGKGTGGFAEVSGGFLLYDGSADLRSTSGQFGDLLLDPYNITISTAPSSGTNGFTATADNSVINVDALTAALATANVTVFTGNAGAQAGNIAVAAPISWTSGSNLTLRAENNITISGAITATNGGLLIDAGGAIAASGAVDVDYFNLLNGAWSQTNPVVLAGFEADDFRLTGGSFRRHRQICTEGCSRIIMDIYGLQGVGSDPTFLGLSYNFGDTIDATGTAGWNGGAGFDPIGSVSEPFTGSFSGSGNVILGLTINRPNGTGVGLVGHGTGAVFWDIGMVDASIIGLSKVGTFAGNLNYGGVNSDFGYSWATGSVQAINEIAGGLIGTVYEYDILNSWARVDVTAGSIVGGFAGELIYTDDIANGFGVRDSYAVGSVTATNGEGIAGGLAGQVFSTYYHGYATISTSYATGAVSADVAGGLVGYNDQGRALNAYWDTETTGQASAVGWDTIDGYFTASGLSSAAARDSASYDGFDFTAFGNWYAGDQLRPMLYSSYSPEIWVPEQLQLLVTYLSSDATLMRDIDMGSVLDDPAGIWGPSGWLPIGGPLAIVGEVLQFVDPYTGNFDGDGHVISGLMIDRPFGEAMGLFGYTSGGSIANVGLTNVDVNASYMVGSLVGLASGTTISNSFAQGVVSGSTASVYAGGLVGQFENATMDQVYADVDVSGGYYVGGLVSFLGANASLTNSYATGPVTANYWVGGLIGGLQGQVSNSYSTGRVIGTVYPDWYVGGFAGFVYEGAVVTSSFWDVETSGQVNGLGIDNAPLAVTLAPGDLTGLTTAQFQNTNTFMTLAGNLGWDFSEIWAPPSAGYYPALYASTPVVMVDLDPASRRYGQSNANVVISGDTFGGPDSYLFGPAGDSLVLNAATLLAGVPADAPVGEYAFGLAGLTSQQGVDYRVISTGGTLTINPALLTVTPDGDFTKVYGDYDPFFGFTVTGFVLNEGPSLVTGALGREAGETVAGGPYALTLGTLSAGGNYDLQLGGSASLNITPALLSVTPDGDFTKVYGEDDPFFGFTVTGFILDDGLSLVTGALGREGGENASLVAYGLTLGNLSAGGNYVLQLSGSSGLLITPRSISIAADDLTQLFGQDDLPLTWQIIDGQLVFGDDMSGDLTREGGTGPGLYAILQGSLTAGSNYDITFIPGTLEILEQSVPPVIPVTPERGTVTDVVFTTIDDFIPDPTDPFNETSRGGVPNDFSTFSGIEFASTEATDTIVQNLNDAAAYCSVIGQSEYVVDCLSERLAVIAAGLPQTGEYAAARAAINQAAQELSALVAANEDTDFPAALTRSLRPDAPAPTRALRPVRAATLDDTLQQAASIMSQTETVLLRSASVASESVHYQRIATAVGSTTILLRSI